MLRDALLWSAPQGEELVFVIQGMITASRLARTRRRLRNRAPRLILPQISNENHSRKIREAPFRKQIFRLFRLFRVITKYAYHTVCCYLYARLPEVPGGGTRCSRPGSCRHLWRPTERRRLRGLRTARVTSTEGSAPTRCKLHACQRPAFQGSIASSPAASNAAASRDATTKSCAAAIAAMQGSGVGNPRPAGRARTARSP